MKRSIHSRHCFPFLASRIIASSTPYQVLRNRATEEWPTYAATKRHSFFVSR